MKHYIYLSGPMSGISDEEASGWRDAVAACLDSPNVGCLSPTRGEIELPILCLAKSINRRDFFDCTRADCVLVNLLGATRVSIGTVMEIAWAYQKHIPIVCVSEGENIHDHPMIEDCITYRVKTLHEAQELIKLLFNERT